MSFVGNTQTRNVSTLVLEFATYCSFPARRWRRIHNLACRRTGNIAHWRKARNLARWCRTCNLTRWRNPTFHTRLLLTTPGTDVRVQICYTIPHSENASFRQLTTPCCLPRFLREAHVVIDHKIFSFRIESMPDEVPSFHSRYARIWCFIQVRR